MQTRRRESSKSTRMLAVTAVLLGLFTPEAYAYCRAALCENGAVGRRCEPPTADDCSVTLAWPSSCFRWTLAPEPSVFLDREATRTALSRASATWSATDCGPTVTSHWREVDPLACDSEPTVDGAPYVTRIRVLDEGWPYPGVYALTTFTFDVTTATLLDADIELDASSRALTTSDSVVEVDVQGLLTHELGHVLGLAHSGESTATMYADPPIGSIAWRELTPDDRLGACDALADAASAACPTSEALEQRCDMATEPSDPNPVEEPSAAPASCAAACEVDASERPRAPASFAAALGLAYVAWRRRVSRARNGSRKRRPPSSRTDRACPWC